MTTDAQLIDNVARHASTQGLDATAIRTEAETAAMEPNVDQEELKQALSKWISMHG